MPRQEGRVSLPIPISRARCWVAWPEEDGCMWAWTASIRACPYLQESYANIRETSLKDAWKAMRSSGQFEGFVCNCPAQNIFG